MHILAVIPAAVAGVERAASRALTERALAAALATRPVSRAVVVGDAPWLLDLALPAGTELVPWPGGQAGERAAALSAALAHTAEGDGFAPALALIIDPACPFLEADRLDAAIQHLLACGADCLLSVHEPGGPVWRAAVDGSLAPPAAGEAAKTYIENGAFAVVRVGVFLSAGGLPAGRVVLFPVSPVAGLRLSGEADDWALAEALAAGRRHARATALLARVRLIIFDFDGVMTDNRVVVFEDGREAVLCNRSDGLGLERLKATGLPLAVISKEKNPVVGARCRKLKIPCHQGIDDKLAVLTGLAAERAVDLADIAYVGNDINDLACMTAVGVPIAPADAYPEVLAVARLVTRATGGFGAVRELADLVLASRSADRAGPSEG